MVAAGDDAGPVGSVRMELPNDPIDAARVWAAHDPDPHTRAELEALIDAGAVDDLADRMDGTLTFGTAGLRGVVEAGSNRMNRAVVIRTTRGVADHLLATTGPDRGPVVVGRDARLSSQAFMEDTIAVLAAAGLDVVYGPGTTPTPGVAFAARELGAVAAIVITASHNPPEYNGYKVYAANHVQIIPPTDREIADAIAEVGPADEVPRVDDPFEHPLVRPIPNLRGDYLSALPAALVGVTVDRSMKVVYTPLHGVGGPYTTVALERAGFRSVYPVARQFEADGRFPTVSFPNPEEPGALDLAHELAAAIDADIVLANDPDVDRLAVSLPEPGGVWRPLTGDQIGVLLADFLLEHGTVDRPIVLNTVVSSPMLASVAEAAGAFYDRTLTGFKWIWNAALALEAEGKGNFLLGYEEAIGYSVWPRVRDKDGISAAAVFAQMAGHEMVAGGSVWRRLERLYRLHGVWVSAHHNIVRPGREGRGEIDAAMDRLGDRIPAELGGLPVTAVTDYRLNADRRPFYLGATPLVEYTLGDRGRALIRPSGTEPKLKIYVDLRGELGSGADRAGVEEELRMSARRVAVALAAFAGFEGS